MGFYLKLLFCFNTFFILFKPTLFALLAEVYFYNGNLYGRPFFSFWADYQILPTLIFLNFTFIMVFILRDFLHFQVQFEEEDIEFKPLSADCKVTLFASKY